MLSKLDPIKGNILTRSRLHDIYNIYKQICLPFLIADPGLPPLAFEGRLHAGAGFG